VLNRLLLLSRAEAVTPYRDTTLAVFQQNRVASWQWFAEIERRPCGMCVALHGRVFPLADPFATHLGCRCLPVPVLPSAPLPVIIGGHAWLAGQDAATQLAVLGPSKLAHYLSGALALDDLITEGALPAGRRARRETTLRDLGLERVSRPAAGAQAPK
ncbi:MAG: phage minor head protein, partial [Chloroflexales bacterium]